MTEITNMVWIGDSKDADRADLAAAGIGAVLVVAHDMRCKRGWADGIEHAQCGLVDGPGNNNAAFHAAVLKLASLVHGGRRTLVVDHDCSGRAVAVTAAGLNLIERRMGWDWWVCKIMEKTGVAVEVKPAHREAFMRLNWRLIGQAMQE